MRFGICCSPEEAETMLGGGFDYVELPASRLSQEPNLYRGLPVECTNIFFAASIKLFGPGKTPYFEYAKGIVEAAAASGVKIMVIGSGGARRAPEGTSVDDSNAGFVDIAAEVAHIARPLGVTVAPESLNRTETNVGNDLGEMATALSRKGVAYTADVFHVLQEWHADYPAQSVPPASLWPAQLPFTPAHVHFADLPRNVPEREDAMAKAFLGRLVELGYDSRISFEGSRSGLEPREILERMRTMWTDAIGP